MSFLVKSNTLIFRNDSNILSNNQIVLTLYIKLTKTVKKNHFSTDSGITIEHTYTKSDHPVEQPGEFPFTRGIQSQMYREKLWTMRQYAGFSTAEESNARYHYLMKQGITGLSVAFDLPTQIGYDSDHPLSEGEVGKSGVAIDTLHDIEILFHGIKTDKVTTSMTINSTACILLCMYIALSKKQGVNLSDVSGTIQNDILKEYIARGTYIFPPTPSMKITTDIFEYCGRELPKFNTISVSGYHIREAGSSAVQELAFTLANGTAYLKAAINAGLDINHIAKRISFFFNSHNNFFEEIAKFRAARRMWAKITKELGVTDLRSQMLRFHAQTGGSTLTAQQPYNNISRVTIQALAAVLGGTQSLHTNGFDEALALPSETSATIALRTQQIIGFESGIADTADPLGGSYFVETLTAEIESKAWEYLKIIEDMGGAISAIEQGYMQKEITNAAYLYQQAVQSKDKIIVGVNSFTSEEKLNVKKMVIDDSIRKTQIEKLSQVKASRDNDKVLNYLSRVEQDARSGNNIIPAILEACEAYSSIGEITEVLRKVYGEYQG